jgi:hypothetical protein
MEYQVRWTCKFCQTTRYYCSICEGRGYLQDWMPLEFLRGLAHHPWVIVDRRLSPGANYSRT